MQCNLLKILQKFNIPGMYYRRTQYPEALKLFENALEVLGNLDLTEEPVFQT